MQFYRGGSRGIGLTGSAGPCALFLIFWSVLDALQTVFGVLEPSVLTTNVVVA